MTAVVIVGAQWGDEGKGKVVDLLAERADVVVRYAGGPNAGHTLVVGEERMVLRLVPSGVLHPHVTCILGQGMVVSASVLLEEIDGLEARGVKVQGRLRLSELAHLILPYHLAVDALRESSQKGTKIGTTKRGIGPCYEDKAARRGLRTGDLRRIDRAKERVAEAIAAWSPVIRELGGEIPTVDQACADLEAHAARLLPLCADTSFAIEEAVAVGKRIMLEGAQGTMLDLDHGTYPYVTSSSAVAGGACTGAGVGPSRIDRVLGITKAYTTRVGEGPFPTELNNATGAHLRAAGGEFGSVTGRPRRTGWLDIPALRYARRVNGLDGLCITKLDVLSGLDELSICTAYDTPDGRTTELPLHDLAAAKPIYETLPGWKEDVRDARSLDDLPKTAARYLRFIEESAGAPLFLVSVGPRRGDTIVLRDAFAARTL
jgi:adenylosuccinate synthase